MWERRSPLAPFEDFRVDLRDEPDSGKEAVLVATAARKEKTQAFAGICRLKSNALWTRIPVQLITAASPSVRDQLRFHESRFLRPPRYNAMTNHTIAANPTKPVSTRACT